MSKRRKTGKHFDHVAMYPARADEDEDDIQAFKHPRTETEKRERSGMLAYEHVDRERHMPDDAVIDKESEEVKEPADPDKVDPREALMKGEAGEVSAAEAQDARVPVESRKRKAAKAAGSEPYRKRRLGALTIGTRVSDYGYNPDDQMGMGFGLEPLPFEDLLADITQWEIRSSPHEYQRFPFHIQKCADYQWVCVNRLG